MGDKGSEQSQDSIKKAQLLIAKLSGISHISSKRMFGGHGIFHNGRMFGMVDSKGQAFLKTDATNKSEFEKKGAQQHSRMPYFGIPKDVWNQPEELLKWAHKSIEISK